MNRFSNKKFIAPAIVVVALLLGFGTAFAAANIAKQSGEHDDGSHATRENHTGSSHEPEAMSDITADASIKSVKADQTVNLLSGGATPGEVYLKVGQVLQFNTKDGKTHRIALGKGGTEHEHTSATDSGSFGKDEGWRVRFDHTGTYFFHDHFNPKTSVLVVVYKPNTK